jgi:hypothetical protein
MPKTEPPRLGDRKRITLNRYFDYGGIHYLPFDEVEVDAGTASYLIESGLGELTIYEKRN